MAVQTEPWVHREVGWSAATAAQSESLLALSNGYLGIRGTLDEGEPAGAPGTYLNGFHETVPIPYADRGYADPELDQVLVNVTDGTRIRLMVGDQPLDISTGTVREHERTLDLRAGMLLRTLTWRSPGGHEVRVRSRRLVSLVQPQIAAIEYEIEAVDGPVPLTVHSELSAQGRATSQADDPRSADPLPPETLVPVTARCRDTRAVLVHRTRRTRQTLAAAMEHVIALPVRAQGECVATDSLARWSLSADSEPGRPIRFVKLLAYRWADDGEAEALADGAEECIARAVATGFDQLASSQREALDEVWERAGIDLEGDDEIQHALRYSLFQVHQNAACADGRAIPAKGLTGAGYNGHAFWDTEIFVLPVLTYCAPDVAANALRWRASTLPKARARARTLGLDGAAFAWRTIAGEECSGYMPAGSAAFHVNADIAHAAVAYVQATGDERFDKEVAAPLLVETARLWASLGHHDPRRGNRFSIDGVTGPDEYSALVDNNLYTNLMAQANLRAAADAAERHGTEALGVRPQEVRAWRRAADAIVIARDEELGIHLQDEDFTRHAPFDFAALPADQFPLLLHVPYVQLYRRQVIKQPDLVLAMLLKGDAFSAEEKLRNFAYYEARTVRDSSLAPGTHSVIAAEVGHLDLAYDYLAEAALLDHGDFMRNTADGLHLAALASGWHAVIEGLAGMRHHQGGISFAPRLPAALRRISFPLVFKGRRLRVEVAAGAATYRLLSGDPLQIRHWDTPLDLSTAASATAPLPATPPAPPLRQPPGRAPLRRRPRTGESGES